MAKAKSRKSPAKPAPYVQINVKFKKAVDIAMIETLRERFEDKTDSGIARLAIKRLAEAKN